MRVPENDETACSETEPADLSEVDEPRRWARPSENRRCTAKSKRSGKRCRRAAIRGGWVCASHGARSPQVKAAAQRRVAEAYAAELLADSLWNVGAAPTTDPVDSLQRLAGKLEQAVDVLGMRAEAGDAETPTGEVWLRAASELRKLLADMARLGIAERHVELERRKVALVAAAFGAALDLLSLDSADRDRVARRFIESLRAQQAAEESRALPRGGGADAVT